MKENQNLDHLSTLTERFINNMKVDFNKAVDMINHFPSVNFNNMAIPKTNIVQELIEDINKDLYGQLDDCFVEGLKRKGFEFDNKSELESFIKEFCRCEDNIEKKERVYYVDDIPFLFHHYTIEIITDPLKTGCRNVISASLGEFRYL